MLFEAYTGARPGRPRLLLLVSAGLLAGALGLACWQVDVARGLGPEQRINGTPLWIRPPRDWHPDPRNPQRFLLRTGDGRRREVFERRIQFDFIRLPAFEPVERLARLPELIGRGNVVQVAPAWLGPYRAVEVRSLELVQIGRVRFGREMLARLTCLPRGHVIRVLYEPLSEMGPADEAIVDEVCRTLRVDDPTLGSPPAEYLQRAGLTLPLEEGWQVVGADFTEVPGVYIGGLANELPAWSIAVYRTWLAAGRTPRDLLADFAAERWLLWDVLRGLHEERRADGATIVTIRHPRRGQADELISSAWVVQQSASQAVILFVYAGPQEADRADEAAARIAAALTLAPLESIPAIAEAEAAGVELADDLRKKGPVSRWGRETVDTTYRRRSGDVTVVMQRSALRHDPAQGYEGSLWRRIGRTREEREVWRVDGHAAAYTWRADFYYDQEPVQVVEQRARASGEVVRQVLVDERERQSWAFRPGPTFVPPPTETIVKGWVARNEPSAAIMEVSSLLGPGTHTVLLRHLPLDGAYPRVLVQQDYWPLGTIEAYDDARAETQYEISPTAEYRRVK